MKIIILISLINIDGEDGEFKVNSIDIKDIHDGTLSVESPNGKEMVIHHDDIIKTTPVSKRK